MAMNIAKRIPATVTKLWAKNFRSLKEIDLDLDRLIVLVGPNASGKSNIVDVLRFIADAWRIGLDQAVLARNGMTSLRRWSPKGRPYDVEVGLCIDDSGFRSEYSLVMSSLPYGQFRVKREHFATTYVPLSLLTEEYETEQGQLVKPRMPERWVQELPSPEPSDLILPSLPLTLRAYAARQQAKATQLPLGKLSSRKDREGQRFSRFRKFIRDMSFYNIFPDVVRQPQALALPNRLTEHGDNIASVLRKMRRSGTPMYGELRDALSKMVPGVLDAEVSQLGRYVTVKLRHEGLGRRGENALFEISQEADGTLRLLGILVALFHNPEASLIGFEEPELNIHPGALGMVADLLKEATTRTQIIATTHSPDLIDLLGVDSLRAVILTNGITRVGPIAEHQKAAVRKGLFSPGELHRLEGLDLATTSC